MDLSCKMLFGLPLGNIIVDLGIHFVLNITTVILLLLTYFDHSDGESFTINSTLNAAGVAFATAGTLISMINIYGEGFSSEKSRLKNEYFNFLRNLMTSFTLVMVAMQNAQVSRDLTRTAMWLMVVQRLVDMCLDVDTPWTLVCDNMEKVSEDVNEQSSMLNKGMYFMKQLLVSICFICILVFQGIYADKHSYDPANMDLNDSTKDDDFYQFMIFLCVSLHLLLVLINILVENTPIKTSVLKCLTPLDGPDCGEDHTVFGLNSIPLVTKTVFTANLFFLACLAGEHIEDDKNVGWLIFSSIALATADMVARNII